MTGLPNPIAIACLLQYSGVPTIHQILLSRAETDYPKVPHTAAPPPLSHAWRPVVLHAGIEPLLCSCGSEPRLPCKSMKRNGPGASL